MEKIFGPAYTGDPGVPHVEKEIFTNIFWGAVGFTAMTAVNPYHWQYNRAWNYHDWAMVCENYQLKKSIRKRRPYEAKLFNKTLSKEQQIKYYDTWQDNYQ